MRFFEFAPSADRDHNDDVPDPIFVLANRWWNAGDRQPQIEHVLNSLGWSIHQNESEDDGVQLQHRDGTTHYISADEFDPDLFESLSSLVSQDQAERNEYSQFVKSKAGSDWNKGAKLYAQLKNRPANDIFGDSARLKQFMTMKFDFAKFTDIDWNNYWLLAQHCDDNRAFQKQALATIKKYQGEDNSHYQYLYDRISCGLTGNQKYGTQDICGIDKQGIMEIARIPQSELGGWGVNEISDKLRRDYLHRAGQHVDRRMDHMARVRDRLNKGYEIYHADRPAGSAQIVDRFEADTPALARQYYERFIQDYESDRDFDLRLRRATGIMEIARIPQSELGGWGDKDTLAPMAKPPKNRKPLPGGSGYTYAVNRKDPEFMEIMIFDGDTLAAELDLFATRDPLKTWRVETVITDPDYRGQGMGKALYGIALSILKLTIEAGETQTKFGQAMWLMLDSIPGVEVLGYAMTPTKEYRPRPGDRVVDKNDTWTRYTFPVEPGRRSMRSTRRGTGIYSSQYVSMIAKWTGQ